MSIIIPRRRFLIGAAALLATPAVIRPAMAQGPVLGQQGSMGGGGSTSTTWNPSDKNAGITLSGGNLIATTTGNQNVRSIASHSSGKYYYEIVWTVRGSTVSCGVATSAYSLSGFIGSSTNAVGWLNDGRLILNSSQIASVGSRGTNVIGGMAIDLDNMKMWFRINGGAWNGGGDPATNSGGTSISGLAAGPYFAIGNGETSGDSFTANFGGSAYSAAIPSGFSNW